MKPDVWWKNFGLGLELDTSGTFIYNGLKTLDALEVLEHSVDIFEVLYNLSVGIERLFKVAVVLLEHNDQTDIPKFEKSLISHNCTDLAKRINAHSDLGLSPVHNEYLAILSKFYKTHRYGRYSLASAPKIEAEKQLFLDFLRKHLCKGETEKRDGLAVVRNSDRIKKFVGKVTRKITNGLYDIVVRRAGELNIYTYELRCDSKASKVFRGERLDFLDEMQAKREMLLFLMNSDADDPHLAFIRSLGCLNLDPAFAPAYIKTVLRDTDMEYVEGEVEAAYENQVDDIRERFKVLPLIECEYLHFEDDEEP